MQISVYAIFLRTVGLTFAGGGYAYPPPAVESFHTQTKYVKFYSGISSPYINELSPNYHEILLIILLTLFAIVRQYW
jgi:hypothetical protein